LLDSIIEIALERSPALSKLSGSLNKLSQEIKSFSNSIITLTTTVVSHEIALQELYDQQATLYAMIKQSAIDAGMPEIAKKNDLKPN
jgi:hypothetical protein